MSFSRTSRHLSLEGGHTLKAECQKADGSWGSWSTLDLNNHIGNIDGHFEWGKQDFSKSTRSIGLHGAILTGDPQRKDGSYPGERSINLDERIANMDGHLRFQLGAYVYIDVISFAADNSKRADSFNKYSVRTPAMRSRLLNRTPSCPIPRNRARIFNPSIICRFFIYFALIESRRSLVLPAGISVPILSQAEVGFLVTCNCCPRIGFPAIRPIPSVRGYTSSYAEPTDFLLLGPSRTRDDVFNTFPLVCGEVQKAAQRAYLFTRHPPPTSPYYNMSFQESSQNIRIDDGHVLVAECCDEGGNWHWSSIDLNQFIGNEDGYFMWDGVNFSHSGSNISLEGSKLCASLQCADGSWNEEYQGIELGDRIANINGQLVYQS
ncbi:hypothetical protein CTheo_8733 [Ceratobasidium theobromae]|uniref:Cyanovirin-N domain-containing protein n=1 Tax=Ceratobasidium theobromae TaxID=1582974 RepID=A0A5N5Q7W0_9AGAM|nr:hypothetical protein CTheo_8733 [Ceratobasidium theobromae]